MLSCITPPKLVVLQLGREIVRIHTTLLHATVAVLRQRLDTLQRKWLATRAEAPLGGCAAQLGTPIKLLSSSRAGKDMCQDCCFGTRSSAVQFSSASGRDALRVVADTGAEPFPTG